MGREIERKFLVRHEGWRPHVVRSFRIQQAYLASTPTLSMRVRVLDGAKAFLTIKSAAKELSRSEFEYAIPLEDAQDMMALSEAQVLEKTRHEIGTGGLTWELDVFGGRHTGLTLAEVELPASDHTLSLPDWVGEEVTGVSRFYNENLARR